MSVLLAALIDRWWGEPPTRVHPVVWMGRYLGCVGRSLPGRGAATAFALGTLYWLLGAGVVGAAYWCAGRALARLPVWAEIPLTALLLKPLFALRMLLDEVSAVERALIRGVERGRARLSRIVSRDTAELSAAEIRESALESLAENLSDSVVAPLFWFVLLGLPGAAVYRFANTADAMWGYRDRWEWAGKFAARADDLLNIVPSRLTAVTLLLSRSSCWRHLRALLSEAVRTPSPNSGWPMAALALALNVRLGKPGVYTLNETGAVARAVDFTSALRLATVTAWIFVGLFAIATEWVRRAGHT